MRTISLSSSDVYKRQSLSSVTRVSRVSLNEVTGVMVFMISWAVSYTHLDDALRTGSPVLRSVYRTLSDLNNLQMLKDRFEQVKDQIPEDKRKEMEKLKDLKFDSDSIDVYKRQSLYWLLF